jgi:hypothetical protein
VALINVDLSHRSSSDISSSPPVPLGVSGTWTLASRDEFDNPTIDPNKWIRAGDAGGSGYTADPGNIFDYGPNPTAWTPSNISISGSVATFSVTSGSPPVGGGVASLGKITVGYGYLEVRCRGTTGAWPAVWLMTYVPGSVKEIDLAERAAWNGTNSDFIHALHTSYSPDVQETHSASSDGTNWHVYGVWWQPGQAFKFYVDGVLTWTSTFIFSPGPDQYWILSNTSFSGSSGDSGALEVDYVRYWTGS